MTDHKKLSIVFMGTPEFAVTILDKLHIEGYDIKAVVTATDKPAGRGRKIQESDVKKYAVEKKLPLLQPSSLKDESFHNELQQLKADLFIVVAFRMLPKSVWSIPKDGTINLHGSLLPQYRGAAPINWAVINGDEKTGVTTFFINEKIDTGDLLLQKEMKIGENETAGEVHDRMMHLGADTVLETVEMIESGKIKAIPQNTEDIELRPAPKIFKNDCLLNFDLTIKALHDFIRGMSPFPTAWFHIKKKEQEQVKIFKVYKAEIQNEQPNTEVSLEKNEKELHLKTKHGTLNLLTIQLEGKKRMDAKQFLTGFNPEEWEVSFVD
jgi:methionyl-tRNA formyltransferase